MTDNPIQGFRGGVVPKIITVIDPRTGTRMEVPLDQPEIPEDEE